MASDAFRPLPKFVAGAAIVSAIIAALFSYLFIQPLSQSIEFLAISSRYASQWPGYISAAETPEPVGYLVTESFHGRAITIDTAKKSLDQEVFLSLPSKYRAYRPDEVRTIVALTWKEVVDAKSYYNAVKYKHDCHVKVVDWKTGKLLGWGDVEGEWPAMGTYNNATGNHYGEKPINAVRDRLLKIFERDNGTRRAG